MDFFQELTDHFPLLATPLINLATLYLHSKAHEEAIDALQFVLVCDDQIGETYYFRNYRIKTPADLRRIELSKVAELFFKQDLGFAPHIIPRVQYDKRRIAKHRCQVYGKGVFTTMLYLCYWTLSKIGRYRKWQSFYWKTYRHLPFLIQSLSRTMLEFCNDMKHSEMVRLIEAGQRWWRCSLSLSMVRKHPFEDELYPTGEAVYSFTWRFYWEPIWCSCVAFQLLNKKILVIKHLKMHYNSLWTVSSIFSHLW